MKYAFLLTCLSGLSTLIGYLLIFKRKNENVIISSLAFASGVMITVSFIDLIKEAFNYLIKLFPIFPAIIYLLIFIISGILLSILIDKFIPKNNELYRVGVYSLIAIVLHNIPEGIITFLTTSTNISLGLSLTIAIALHNIPEGISIAVPIYYAKNSKIKAFLYTLLSAVSEPIGAILAYLIFNNINERILGITLGITAGIMIHISLFELLPTSLNYNNKKRSYLFFILGIVIMLIANFII